MHYTSNISQILIFGERAAKSVNICYTFLGWKYDLQGGNPGIVALEILEVTASIGASDSDLPVVRVLIRNCQG